MTTANPTPSSNPVAPTLADRSSRERWVHRARWLAWAGIGWHVIEFAVAIGAGIAASSVALVAFGADSLIEGLAGAIIIWRFAAHREASDRAERRAQRLIAASYLVLAAYIGAQAGYALIEGVRPDTSWIGIALAVAAAASMPLLARAKWRVAAHLDSRATTKEGSQNMLCAYMSIALLFGLLANTLFGWWWADPLAALVIAAIALREARDSWRGEPDGCCAPVPIEADPGCGGACCHD